MARSNSSSRRSQVRQRRNQLSRRGVLSNKTLLLGSMAHTTRIETRGLPGGEQITREETRTIPTSEALELMRNDKRRVQHLLTKEQQRIDTLKSTLASTSKLRFLKRYSLKDDISRAKLDNYDTRRWESEINSQRKNLESEMKRIHRAKLKAMRKSRGPNLP